MHGIPVQQITQREEQRYERSILLRLCAFTMVTKKPTQTLLPRMVQFLKFHILYANDSPHCIALGVAIGLFVAWMPLPGLLMLTVLGLTTLLKVNKLAGLAAVLVNNPFTIVPIYYSSYLFGRKILALFGQETGTGLVQADEIFSGLGSTRDVITGVFHADFWPQFGNWMMEIGTNLCVGCLCIGLPSSCVGYLVTLQLVRWHRKKYLRQRDLSRRLKT